MISFFYFMVVLRIPNRLFLQAQPRIDTIKVKDCPIYDQLCAIFADTSADGKYAQSSHFEGLEKSVGNNTTAIPSCLEDETQHPKNPSCSRLVQGNGSTCENVMKNIAERKRKRSSETHSSLGRSRRDQEILEGMAGALSEMIAASKLRSGLITPLDDRFTITNCIAALDEIETLDDGLYLAALDLFEDPNLRETFLSLNGDKIRLTWLQGKCGKTLPISS